MDIDWKKWWPSWGESRVDDFHGELVESEPYMVTVQASHVSGDAALFDSEHRHSGFVALRIHSAERQRGLSRDWIHARKELIEVHMSHAQWAAMISTPNSGTGTPGTLCHVFQQRVEQPQPDRRTEKFGPELMARLDRALAKIDALMEEKMTKAQKAELAMVRQEIVSNMPFVANQFEEHMETRVQKARSDIEAHMQASVQRVGLAALAQSERLAKLLEGPKDA
jgi:hypothetical protein